MSELNAQYLRADIDAPAGLSPWEPVRVSTPFDASCSISFVDLQTNQDGPSASLESLTAVVQENLLHIASSTVVIFRWPWYAPAETEPHSVEIDAWLERLTSTSSGAAVLGTDVTVGVVQHRVGSPHFSSWVRPRDSPDTDVAIARALELQALLRRSEAVWTPTSYHYRLPNGEHAGTFVRLADAIQSPRDAFCLASWLTPQLRNGVGLLCDTGSLTPIILQVESFLAKSAWRLGPVSILDAYPSGRPAVRQAVENAIPFLTAAGVMAIQSVSSTGGLRRTIEDELDRASTNFDQPHTLDVLVDRQLDPAEVPSLTPVADKTCVSWVALGDSSANNPTPCELCQDSQRAQVIAIDPRTYGQMALPEPMLIMPATTFAKSSHLFWERVAKTRGISIEANPHPASRDARGKRTALPVRPIFELIVSGDGLAEMVRSRLQALNTAEQEDFKELKHAGLVLVRAVDIADTPTPAFAGQGATNLANSLTQVLHGLGVVDVPVITDDQTDLLDKAIAELRDNQSILTFSWGSVTGLTMRRLKIAAADALGRCQKSAAVRGLIFHSRTGTSDEWSAQGNQFRPQNLLSLWRSTFPWTSPLATELRLLDRSGIYELPNDAAASAFLEMRKEFLQLHDTFLDVDDDWSPRFEHDGQNPTHVFWGMTSANRHQQQVRGRSLYGSELDPLAAYAAIGSVIHQSRIEAKPTAAPRWVMFDMPRLVRSYFDAIITCSAIRWMNPGELWWGTSTDDELQSVAFLLDQATGVDEQVLIIPELLLAAALGKIPKAAIALLVDRARLVSDEWKNDSELQVAVGAVGLGLALLEKS